MNISPKEYIDSLISKLKNNIINTFYKKEEIDNKDQEIKDNISDLKLRTHIGKQLDYVYLKTSSTSLLPNNIVPFTINDTNNENITVNNGVIEINAIGKTYRVTCGVLVTNSNFKIINADTNELLGTVADSNQSTANCIIRNKIIKIAVQTAAELYPTIDNNYLFIEEINRQVILDPAEDAKNLEFDYAVFKMDSDKTISANTIGVLMNFDSLKYGNMVINENKNIILKPNKRYKINLCMATKSGCDSMTLYNVTDSCNIDENNFSLVNHSAYSTNSISTYNIDTTKEIEICLINKGSIANTIDSNRTYIEIQEIAHPYYFNYFKDSISSKILFKGEASDIGEYELLDDITNYEWIEFILRRKNEKDCIRTNKIYISDIKNKLDSPTDFDFVLTSENSSEYTNNIIYINFNNKNTFNISYNISNILEIFRIVGYGFNYDNPYKDLISSGGNVDIDEFEFTDEEIENNLAGIWGDE